ncbi:YggS family pyridoxal phosphate-dependent enzyme [Raoultibacter phocaeensis]|uniref:YggS family pyridoxal phosphate-dependent enzyme n=1 Tax=Raoultibacter phocaeensis TaxID=2479841 RepID=UPI001119F53C|nr:YggS family pyridoxal phosphate-dependent enzyme [Raoultibacter phocaeensis]
MSIETRYRRLEEEIAKACMQAGRDPHEVALVAVSKTVGADEVSEAFAAGARNFGENRPDGLLEKAPLHAGATWHFIGNIQSRRIGDIVAHADLVHSLFEERHADKIDAAARAAGKVQDVLIEVNVSGEASKSGRAPDEAALLVEHCLGLANVRVRGLMTMAPQGDLAGARACFELLHTLRDELKAEHSSCEDDRFMHDLSMGMSEDWREGIAAGATIVRIGRAVFDDAFE